jgi:hypothetical protein
VGQQEDIMGVNITIDREPDDERPRIGDLEYKTWVTDVPNGSNCVYVKIKKGEHLNKKKGHSLLLNLDYGTVRQVKGDTRVTPLVVHAAARPVAESQYHTVKK